MATENAHGDPSTWLAGTNYQATRVLGRGGMGVVVEAVHVELGKRFAVKLLSSTGTPDPAFEEDRLRVEAQALANIDSPHVVKVHHIGRTAAGQLYVVMDLLRGQSLAEELAERGRFPVRDALLIARDALAGLHAAHKLGIVHRDIKPANIFLVHEPDSPRGHFVKVLDFGVAKITEAAERHGIDAPVIPTKDGYFMGTPRFFSPEHVTYGPFDGRTDLYGIGLVLYVTLTGRGPFDEEKGLSGYALAAATTPPPPPSRFASDRIDAALDKLVLRALEKRPADRFADARAFIRAIDDYLDAHAPAPQPASAQSEAPSRAQPPSSGRRPVATELIEDPVRVNASPLGPKVADGNGTEPLRPAALPVPAKTVKMEGPVAARARLRVPGRSAREPFRTRPFVIAMAITLAMVGLAVLGLRWALAPG